MMKTTRNIRANDRVPLLTVAPDHAVLGFTLRLSTAKGPELPTLVRQAVDTVAAAASSASVEMVGYRSWTEKLAGKSLFGAGVRSAAQATGRIVLPLAEADDLFARITAVESLRARLQAVDMGEVEFEFGECEYTVRDRERHRPAAIEALRRHIDASTGGLEVARIELDPTLSVEVQGPTEAHVELSATVVLTR